MRQGLSVKLLLAGLLMLLPLPALADVTAHYSVGSKDHLTIEADDGGNLRASVGEKFAMIRRDGVDYVVVILPNGESKVANAGAVVDVLAAQLKGQASEAPSGKSQFEMKQGGEDSFAGFGGTVWLVSQLPGAPGQPIDKPFDVLISPDPALAPVGGFFHRLSQLLTPMLGLLAGGDTNLGQIATDLFAKGAPLRFGQALTLDSVDHAEIAPARFDLPGPVIEPIEFLLAVMPSESGAGLPPLP